MKGSYRELHSAIIRAGFTCSISLVAWWIRMMREATTLFW